MRENRKRDDNGGFSFKLLSIIDWLSSQKPAPPLAVGVITIRRPTVTKKDSTSSAEGAKR